MAPKKRRSRRSDVSPNATNPKNHETDASNKQPPLVNAGVSIKPPAALVIKAADMGQEWLIWKQQFNWYSKLSAFESKSEDIKVAILMSAMGHEATKIFNSFNLPDDATATDVLKEFDKKWLPQVNFRYERFVFNTKLQQKSGESFDEFLTRLQQQALKCKFSDVDDRLIDTILAGTIDEKARRKLLECEELTLDKAVRICKCEEACKRQESTFQENSSSQVDAVFNASKQKTANESVKPRMINDCSFCGYSHPIRKCPAFGKKCNVCDASNHFASKCKNKKIVSTTDKNNSSKSSDDKEKKDTVKNSSLKLVDQLQSSQSSDNEEFSVYAVCESVKDDDWYEDIKIGEHSVKFKLDSGAQCTVIPAAVANSLNLPIVESKTKRLRAYGGSVINVTGESSVLATVRGNQFRIKIIIAESNVQCILGKKHCVAMGLIKRIDSVQIPDDDIVFKGLGCLKNFEYDIDLVEDAKFTIHPPRRVPHSIKEDVKKEIVSMVKLGVLEPISQPTPAVSPMVVVRKFGKIRICIDPSDINANTKRRHFPIKTVEEVLAKIHGARYFAKMDLRKGYWQIKVSDRTKKYLCMATPWGRFVFTRLPFGVTAAPEILQQIMSELFQDLEGVEVVMDDVLVFAETQEELEIITAQAIARIRDAGLKLNKEKCIFNAASVKFVGHVLTSEGALPNPENIEAINRLKTPRNKREMKRFLGSVNYLSKFIPNQAELTAPLRALTKDEVAWFWSHEQDDAVRNLKRVLSSPPVLRYYNVNEPVKISVDASSYAVGAVLLQNGQPIAYASKSLSETEKKYPQIEKEAFAMRFGCVKFHEYVYGKDLTIETDHKPLESIAKKHLHKAPARLRRILFDVLQYNPKVVYSRGSQIPVPDILSRDCENEKSDQSQDLEVLDIAEVEVYSILSVEAFRKLRSGLLKDTEINELDKVVSCGWPEKINQVPEIIKKYFPFRDEISKMGETLLKEDNIIIPSSLKNETMKMLHQGHLGVNKTVKRAKDSVFWPGMLKDITDFVLACDKCQELQRDKNKSELIVRDVPVAPWQFVAVDLFDCKGKSYVLIADHYSTFFNFKKLNSKGADEIIRFLKNEFVIHGIPEILYSDNGPQFSALAFQQFSQNWSFKHVTSSPLFPQSNGFIEKAVSIAKNVIKKAESEDDVLFALLNIRNASSDEKLGSPVQRLFSRRTRTIVPMVTDKLKPQVMENVAKNLRNKREQQKKYFDHGKSEPDAFNVGDPVLVRNGHRNWIKGTIKAKADSPRSYWVTTIDGNTYRRNEWFIRKRRLLRNN